MTKVFVTPDPAYPRLRYPTYRLTPAQVTATFEAAGLVVSAERAATISAEMMAGELAPHDFIVAQADAESDYLVPLMRHNVETLRGLLASTDPRWRRASSELRYAELAARLARLDARAAKGLHPGPGAAKRAQAEAV